MEKEYLDTIERISEMDQRYNSDAYHFVMEALNYTQYKFKCVKHVSTEEILDGMRDLLLDKYGPLALSVLKHWGIRNTEDLGNIVFNLVENKVLSKTDDDRIEKFRDAYDFSEVFIEDYRKQLHKKVSRMRSM